jgi:hypothetical protein
MHSDSSSSRYVSRIASCWLFLTLFRSLRAKSLSVVVGKWNWGTL